MAFDVCAGCCSFLYSLDLASTMVHTGRASKLAVVGAEVLTKMIDYTDRGTCILFGDGAAAAIVAPSSGDTQVLSADWGCDPSLASLLEIQAGGGSLPASAETVANRQHYLQMDGRRVFREAVRRMSAYRFSDCLLYTSPSPRDLSTSRMPSSA